MRPQPGTYPDYYGHYIPLVTQDNIMDALQQGWDDLQTFVATIPADKEEYAYAPGKWTVKQVIHHLIDTERIMTYRALRFARKDPQQPLPYEEDHYASHSESGKRTLADLLEEFDTVRKATNSLYRSFSDPALLSVGHTAIGQATVLAIGYMTCGHAVHHLNVLRERYLIAV